MMKKLCFALACALLCITSLVRAQNKGVQLLQYSGEANKNINCGDIIELSNASAYTIEMWVKFPLTRSYTTLYTKMNADESNRLELQVLATGQLVVYQRNKDGQFMQSNVGVYPNDDAWHHIALVYSGGSPSSVKLYVDGNAVTLNGSSFAATTGDTSGFPFMIGKPSQATYDEVRIWSVALTASTLAAWRDHKINNTHPSYNKLVACYSFDNAAEGVIPDLKNKYPATYDPEMISIANISLPITDKESEVELPNTGMQLLQYSGEDVNNMICGDIIQLNSASEYTVETWLKINLSERDYYVIFKKEKNDNDRFKVQLYKNGDIYIMQNGAYCNSGGGKYPDDGEWHHLALTYKNGTATLYVDGEIITTGTTFGSNTPNMAGVPFVVGSPSTGIYDEIRVWSQALSLTEIKAYQYKKVDNLHPAYSKLIAYYNFEGVITTQVPDLKENYPATVSTQMAIIPVKLAIKDNGTSNKMMTVPDVVNIQVYPTVVSEGFFVKTQIENPNGIISLYNASGMLVYCVDIAGESTFVETDALSQGLYWIKIIANGKSIGKSILKK